MMILTIYYPREGNTSAYIAGTADGIVSINGSPVSCPVYLIDAESLNIVDVMLSTRKGNYIFTGLDPAKKYMVMGRDYNKKYEPAVWDYVTPATDLTPTQQQELWQSWQNNEESQENIVGMKLPLMLNRKLGNVNPEPPLIINPGYINGTIDIFSCLESDFYIQCYQTEGNFIGNYEINSDGTYTIPNLDTNQFYDIHLVDRNKIMENQVHSMRKPTHY